MSNNLEGVPVSEKEMEKLLTLLEESSALNSNVKEKKKTKEDLIKIFKEYERLVEELLDFLINKQFNITTYDIYLSLDKQIKKLGEDLQKSYKLKDENKLNQAISILENAYRENLRSQKKTQSYLSTFESFILDHSDNKRD